MGGAMSVRKVPRDPESFELLRLYGEAGAAVEGGTDLNSDELLDEFLDRARRSIRRSVSTPSRMHGLRVQGLFRGTLVALGRFRRLNDEDTGHPYYEDGGGAAAPPDFRVVDDAGDSLLIEVKSVKLKDPLKPFRLRRSDVDAWRSWGDLDGTPVALALWWQIPGLWTLVPLDPLTPNGTKAEIDLVDAIAANEMARFGDAMLATRPPLSMRLELEETDRTAIDDSTAEHSVLLGRMELRSGDQVLEDDLERRIAWWILRFGRWPIVEEPQIGKGGGLEAIILTARPGEEEELQPGQDFTSVGTLSSLYAALFEEATTSRDGDRTELERQAVPNELSDLIPTDYWDDPRRVLPLWRFNVQPAAPGTVSRGRAPER